MIFCSVDETAGASLYCALFIIGYIGFTYRHRLSGTLSGKVSPAHFLETGRRHKRFVCFIRHLRRYAAAKPVWGRRILRCSIPYGIFAENLRNQLPYREKYAILMCIICRFVGQPAAGTGHPACFPKRGFPFPVGLTRCCAKPARSEWRRWNSFCR